MLAFIKILKKFDKVSKWDDLTLKFLTEPAFGFLVQVMKRGLTCVWYSFQVTGKQVLPIYLKVVESSYFNSSDKVKFIS